MAKKADEAAARALFEAGKDAAKRALEDFGLSDEEKATREAERARDAKLRRWKWIAIVAAIFVVGLALVFLIAKFWLWVLLLAVVAVGGYIAYRWARGKLAAGPEIKVVPAKREVEEVPKPKAAPVLPPMRDPDEEAARIERELQALKKKVEK
ncbi:MAG: hypothetical protein ACXVEF_34485 [Polyangiales bacterium]